MNGIHVSTYKKNKVLFQGNIKYNPDKNHVKKIFEKMIERLTDNNFYIMKNFQGLVILLNDDFDIQINICMVK